MPIEVMLSNVGRFEVPAAFSPRVDDTRITGGRRAGDQLFLIVPVSINGELFVPIAHTEPFLSAEFAADFRRTFERILVEYAGEDG